MSAYATPVLLHGTGASVSLERIALGRSSEAQMSEEQLQKLLFAHPSALPVREIDPNIGQLIPICMELRTGGGPADILYATPTGQLVLVETKLWRNPEARREVVGQILEYARHLASWTYEVLDDAASAAARSAPHHLLRCARAVCGDALDEIAFVDGIGRCLKSGSFLLLIAGDGIRHGAEGLVTFIEKFGHLRFRLALVEVATYAMPGGGTLLQPRVLAKTELLERTILLGPNGPVTFDQLAQAEDAPAQANPQRQLFVHFWEMYLAKLRATDASLGPNEAPKSTNVYIPMPPGGSSAWISAYVAQSSGRGGVYLSFSKSYKPGLEVYELLLSERDTLEKELGYPLTWERIDDKVYIGVPNMRFTDLSVAAEQDALTTYLADKTISMVRALKPRLEAITALLQQ